MKKLSLVFVVLLGILLFYGCGVSTEETMPTAAIESLATETTGEEPFVYVSLGDSIARGYGLQNVSGERYSTIVADTYEARTGQMVETYNYGIDGLTSMGLLKQLQENVLTGLAEASVVSVSIGANNILGPFTQFLYDYYLWLYAEPAQFTAAEIGEKFRAFSEEADEGIAQLAADLPAIVDAIRQVNPDCAILFLDLCNPYEAVNTELTIDGLPISMAAMSDTYVLRIGECLREHLAAADGVTILDVYSAFHGRGSELVCAVTPPDMSPKELDMRLMDPHPNARGHLVLGKLVASAFPEVILDS